MLTNRSFAGPHRSFCVSEKFVNKCTWVPNLQLKFYKMLIVPFELPAGDEAIAYSERRTREFLVFAAPFIKSQTISLSLSAQNVSPVNPMAADRFQGGTFRPPSRHLLLLVVLLIFILPLLAFSFLSISSTSTISSATSKLQPSSSSSSKCDPSESILRVYMYDLPPEFHFKLLGWDPPPSDGAVWPDLERTSAPPYPGGLNLQHSVEYWLTLDLLSSTLPGRTSPCSAIRVADSLDADVIFVPFFSSLSYNRHSKPISPAKVISFCR